MAAEESKKISTEVSKECWKKLKIISIDKDIGINKLVTEILEKFTSRKNNLVEEIN